MAKTIKKATVKKTVKAEKKVVEKEIKKAVKPAKTTKPAKAKVAPAVVVPEPSEEKKEIMGLLRR